MADLTGMLQAAAGGEPPAPPDPFVTTAVWNGTPVNFFSVAGQESTPRGLFLRADGAKMYVIGRTGDDVLEYTLSTPFDLGTASFVQSFVTGLAWPNGVYFKSDGLKMYVSSGERNSSVSYVVEFTLSSAWDVSTASTTFTYETSYLAGASSDITFKADGTQFYLTTINDFNNSVIAYNLGTAWTLSTASFSGTPVNNFYGIGPYGGHFKPDGLKFYYTTRLGASVEEWTLSTAFNLGTVSYTQSFSVAAQTTQCEAVFFRDNGTIMYVLATDTPDRVLQYALSTAWNISTASYTTSFDVSGQETAANGLFFGASGTKMYITGTIGDDVNEYTLSSAWNIATASFTRSQSVAAQTTAPRGIFFRSTGLIMYVLDDGAVYQYALSSAWNVSTASFTTSYTPNPIITGGLRTVSLNSTGTRLFLGSINNIVLAAWNLSTAYNVSTASYQFPTTNYKYLAISQSYGVAFRSNGTIMYAIRGEEVDQFALSTAWNIATTSLTRTQSLAAWIGGNATESIWLDSTGTKVFFIQPADFIGGYSLSTAYNISTISFTYPTTEFFNLQSQTGNPAGIYISPDGVYLYAISSDEDAVFQYTMSSAWDISTASFTRSFSVASQESQPRSVFFKTDGTIMYVTGTSGDDVNQYALSTAWNISTASFTQNFSVAAQENQPYALFFKPDGTKMYVMGAGGDDINEYNLSVAWDISTASFVQSSATSLGQSVPTGLWFDDTGTIVLVCGSSNKTIREYYLSTPWSVASMTLIGSYAGTLIDTNSGVFVKPDKTKLYLNGLRGFQFAAMPVISYDTTPP